MKPNHHSERIETHLTAVRQRIRGVQRTRGVMLVTTVALGGLMAVMALDFLLSPLPVAVRWALTGGWLVAVLATIRFGFGPVFKPISLLQVARWLEGRHPEMEERLSTVLELSGQTSAVSPGLLDALARAAEADADKVDASLEVRTARTGRRWARPAAALLALLALTFAVWPGEASRLLVRAVAPFSDMGNAAAGKFTITPGDVEVLSGDTVRIQVFHSAKRKAVEILMDFANGKRVSQAMSPDGDGFTYQMDNARESFRYRIRSGRDESDSYTVTVWPMPTLLEPVATLSFPAYTGQLAMEISPTTGIAAVVGTRVSLAGRTNTAIESAWLEIAGERVAEGSIENSAKGGRVAFEWMLAAGQSGEAVIQFKHRLGREIDALRFPLEVREDVAPRVTLLSPLQKEFRIRPDELLALKYEVEEDFAVEKLVVEAEGGTAKVTLDGILPLRQGRSEPPVFQGEETVSIGDLKSKLPRSNEIRVRLRAEDGRPADLGGPGVGFSEWITLRIDDGAESLARQQLRQEDEGTRKTLEQAQQTAREGREMLERHRHEMRDSKLNDNARKDFKKSAEQLAEAEAKLDALAKQMKESVHAKQADEVEKAAEQSAKAREELENALLNDDPEQRQAKLDQARETAMDAEKQMEQIRQAMERDRQKIEDLARLMELAQKQQEVARQAAENLAKPAVPDDWKNQQRQVEDQIKQQLRERPDGKAAALKTQAEQAEALANQARETAKNQQNLAQKASPESLKHALAEEQTEIAQATKAAREQAREARSELADSLPEAAAAAEAAKDQLEQDENQAAADSAKAAADAMKQAAAHSPKGQSDEVSEAAQADSLDKLAQRQESVATALADLAKGDAAAAMQKMQAAQAQAAAELAAEISSMPQLDGNGAAQDAKNNSQQGSQQATEASKKGAQSNSPEASKQHAEAGQSFEKAAQALDRAAQEFSQAAQEMAGHQPDPQRAALPPQAMANAFQQAARAASSPATPQAAAQAAEAAKSLSQAAEAGRQAMQGKAAGPPQLGSQPGNKAGDQAEEGPRPAEPDPGIPPELAKLGISSDDWAKIQASLKSDVGAADGTDVPEEYRGLVKSYFESMAQPPSSKPKDK
ncbi:MAG: hypothetical protein V4640_09455 [Verrucomicrobiota bacterium]